jgi:hypothetical protein
MKTWFHSAGSLCESSEEALQAMQMRLGFSQKETFAGLKIKAWFSQ